MIALRAFRDTMAFALALASPHHARQAAGDRSILAWLDTLQRAPAAALAALEPLSRQGTGVTGDLRRALYQMRHADVTGNRGEIELVLTNMQVMANHRRSPWPHYVMALAFESMARKGWIETLSDGKRLAEKHNDAVWRTLRASLDRDSTFIPARRLLARLAVAQGDRFLRPDQLAALQRESRQLDADPGALLAWGRHLRTLREYPAALTAFSEAVDLGGDRGRLSLELARTLLAVREPAAAASMYWAGLANVTPVGREMYRFDLAWITDSTTLAEFDTVPDSALTPWLRKFWNARDAEAANRPGERLHEHLRRWVKVMEDYRALSPWTDAFFSRVEMGFEYAPDESKLLEADDPEHSAKMAMCIGMDGAMFEQLWRMQPSHTGDLRSHEPLLDHRGLLYLRHGEPQRRIDGGGAPGGGLLGGAIVHQARLTIKPAAQARGPRGVLLPWSSAGLGEAPDRPNGPAGESWIYGLGGDWHILQFRGSQALGTYAATTMTQRIPAAWLSDPTVQATIPGMEYVALTNRINENESSTMRRRLRDKMDKITCTQEAVAVAKRTRTDEHFFLNRDTDTPPDLRPSNSVVQAFALGDAADQSGFALVTFAIDSAVLRPQPTASGQSGYDVNYRIVAYDRATDRTITLDTVRHFSTSRPITTGHFLTADFELPLPAGTWSVATRAQQVAGLVAINDKRTIRIDGTATVTLSDIVTGRPGSPGWLATDRSAFPVNYTNGWHADEAADLFFEVRGIPAGSTYRTSIVVRPTDPKARTVVQIGSDDPGAGDVTYVRKSLGLAQLLPGTYILQVTVDYQGAKATRERSILIVPRP